MNFTFQRNPERLLDLCGLSPIRDRRQEKLFMEKAAALDARDLRPLVLVIGGFLDQILGNSYAVSARYPADLRAKHDVWFREHYESRKMRDIVNIYASKGHSVALIGHSWGGDAAVNLVARKLNAPIDLLISLDPVSRKGAVTGFILGGTFLPMVMLGIHQTLTPIHAELLSRYGVTILLPVLAMAGAGQVGASFAVYCKTKNHFLKKTIASALPVGIMGVGEPLIYGVTLPLGKPFIGACIGGACGGAVQAQFMVGAATLGISGLPLAAATDQIPVYLLGLITAYIGGFIATWLIGFDDPPEEK